MKNLKDFRYVEKRPYSYRFVFRDGTATVWMPALSRIVINLDKRLKEVSLEDLNGISIQFRKDEVA